MKHSASHDRRTAGAHRCSPLIRSRRRQLTGAGATFPYPIYSKWFDHLSREDRGRDQLPVDRQRRGHPAGARPAPWTSAPATRALSNAQLKDMPRKVVHFPTVAGAVVARLQPARLRRPASSSRPDLLAGDLHGQDHGVERPDASPPPTPASTMPAAPILPVHRSDGSGTTEHLRHLSRRGERAVEGAGRRRHVGELAGRASAARATTAWPAWCGRHRARSATSSWPTRSRTSSRWR